jgi:hypothetical protein
MKTNKDITQGGVFTLTKGLDNQGYSEDIRSNH